MKWRDVERMFNPMRHLSKRYGGIVANEVRRKLDRQMEIQALLQGRTCANVVAQTPTLNCLADAEFRVFSQWGEDGIIEWLVRNVAVPNTTFIEFGVGNFSEANCRFLMQNRNWKGLIIDGYDKLLADVQAKDWFWRFDLRVKSAFITAENIDELFAQSGFRGPIGILSIDVDGNDYWIWNAIRSVDPAIVICEYNALFGDTRAVTIPYDPEFRRLPAHASGLYFGSSILALKRLV